MQQNVKLLLAFPTLMQALAPLHKMAMSQAVQTEVMRLTSRDNLVMWESLELRMIVSLAGGRGGGVRHTDVERGDMLVYPFLGSLVKTKGGLLGLVVDASDACALRFKNSNSFW